MRTPGWGKLALAGLLCAVCRPSLAEPFTAPPVVASEWLAQAQPTDPPSRWRFADGGYRFVWLKDTPATTVLRRRDPLPTLSWTVDLYLLQTGDSPSHYAPLVLRSADGERTVNIELDPSYDRGEVNLRGNRQNDYWGNDYLDAAAGPLHWVRLSFDHPHGRLSVWVNGERVRTQAPRLALGGARLQLGEAQVQDTQRLAPMELFAFAVQDTAYEPPATLTGPAFDGWRSQPKLTEAVRAQLRATRDKLAARRLDSGARAFALATIAAIERATDGRVGTDTWAAVLAQFPDLSTADRAAAALLLPVAAACGDAAQRADLRPLLPAHFAALGQRQAGPEDDPRDASLRGTLLDPLQALRGPGAQGMHMRDALAHADRLATVSPLDAFNLLARTVHGEWRSPAGAAWLWPRWQAVSPTYADGLIRLLLAWAAQEDLLVQGPSADQGLAILAWRLADRDPARAIRCLAALPSDSEYQAEALEALADRLGPLKDAAAWTSLASACRARLAARQPDDERADPTPVRVLLARCYFGLGRVAEAKAQLELAAGHRGERAAERFEHARLLAAVEAEWQLPDAVAWLEAARTAAVAADADTFDRGGRASQSAVAQLVADVARRGEFDSALKLGQSAPAEATTLCAAIVAVAAETAQPDLAARVLATLPNPRGPLLALARKLLHHEADGLLAESTSLDRVTPLRPAQLAEDIAARVKELGQRHGRWDQRGALAELDKLTPARLWALEPAFGSDTWLFHRQLLETVLTVCGWASDPLWEQQAACSFQGGWSIPWGATRLRQIRATTERNPD